jgi:penicillin-binding protein 2
MLIRSAPGDAPRSPELHRRLRWLVVTVITALGALVGRLWQLQIVRGDEYYELARENVVAESYLPSVRGKILDRNGVALADNRPAFHVYVTPRLIDDAGRDRLIQILRLDPDEAGRLKTRLAAARQRTPGRAVMVLEDVGRDRRGLVAQARLELGPGVEVRDEPYRDYPFGITAAHLIGYMNQPSSRSWSSSSSRATTRPSSSAATGSRRSGSCSSTAGAASSASSPTPRGSGSTIPPRPTSSRGPPSRRRSPATTWS